MAPPGHSPPRGSIWPCTCCPAAPAHLSLSPGSAAPPAPHCRESKLKVKNMCLQVMDGQCVGRGQWPLGKGFGGRQNSTFCFQKCSYFHLHLFQVFKWNRVMGSFIVFFIIKNRMSKATREKAVEISPRILWYSKPDPHLIFSFQWQNFVNLHG